MVAEQALPPRQSKRVLRTVLARAAAGTVFVLVLFAVGAFTASLMLHSSAPQTLAARVHHWLALARPLVLALQFAGLATVWWKWAAIIKRAHFAADVEAAWLAARDRMFYWGLALMGLSVFLWSA
jgi:hypothetical protein